jgi:hypothetical protein
MRALKIARMALQISSGLAMVLALSAFVVVHFFGIGSPWGIWLWIAFLSGIGVVLSALACVLIQLSLFISR